MDLKRILTNYTTGQCLKAFEHLVPVGTKHQHLNKHLRRLRRLKIDVRPGHLRRLAKCMFTLVLVHILVHSGAQRPDEQSFEGEISLINY